MLLFQRISLFSLLSLVPVLGIGPSSWAGETSSDGQCERFFLQLREVKKLVAQRLLLGPEVTFSTPVLQQVSQRQIYLVRDRDVHQYYRYQKREEAFELIHTLMPQYPKEALEEVRRFVDGVFEFDFIEVHSMAGSRELWAVDDQVGIHVPSILLLLRIRNHPRSWVALSLEPACIEVNFAPQKIDEIRSVWAPVFERAHELGFVGYTGLASGGGGGHMHLGFTGGGAGNVFYTNPAYLSEFLLTPLLLSGMRSALASVNDHGSMSNLITPMDREHPEKFLDFVKIWNTSFSSPSSADFRRTFRQEAQLDLIASATEAMLRDHFSYVSLKNFFTEDPRIEMRFIRAYQSLEDLEAVAQMFYHMLVRAIIEPVSYESVKMEYLKRVSEVSIKQQRTEFQDYLEDLENIGFSKRYTRRLLRFGGERVFFPLDIVGQGRDLRGRVSGYLEFDSEDTLAAHSIELRLTEEEAQRVHSVYVQTIENKIEPVILKEGNIDRVRISKRINNLFLQHMEYLTLLDEYGETVSRYILTYTPKVDHPYDAADFRVVLSRVTPEGERRLERQKARENEYYYWEFEQGQMEELSRKPVAFQVRDGLLSVVLEGLLGDEVEWTETALHYAVKFPKALFEGTEMDPEMGLLLDILDQKGAVVFSVVIPSSDVASPSTEADSP